MCLPLFFIFFPSSLPLSLPSLPLSLPSLLPSLFLSFPLQIQYECYTASCQYDGGDRCTLNPIPNDPWANCRNAEFCRKSFKDGVCNVQCNTAECLYDGGDCQPSCPIRERCELGVSDGQCSAECNTQECPYDLVDCKWPMDFVSCDAERVKLLVFLV